MSFVAHANRCFPCLLQARYLGRRTTYGSHVRVGSVGDEGDSRKSQTEEKSSETSGQRKIVKREA
jgi:hypothetical protein